MLRFLPSLFSVQPHSARGRFATVCLAVLAFSSATCLAENTNIHASVRTGSHPVDGSIVILFSAGVTGYGSQPKVLDFGYSDGNGNVTLLRDYTCPSAPRDQLYLVAAGGTLGQGYNLNLAMMAGLGTCRKVSKNTIIVINEVSTVAAAYALSPFMTTAGEVGTSWTNYRGLENAFSTINNLLDRGAGKARTITPAYQNDSVPSLNTSTVPQARIDTLANMLVPCVESTEAFNTSAACATLFAAATPAGGTAPTNTLQAALNIAQNPASNIAALYAIASSPAPFQPALTVAPTDLQLAISYTGAGLGLAPASGAGDIIESALAIDDCNNIWITAYGQKGGDIVPNSSLIAEFNFLGAPITTSTTQPTPSTAAYGGYLTSSDKVIEPIALAIEESGNVWFSGSSGYLDAITPRRTPFLSAPIQTGSLGPVTFMAIDGKGNVWTAGDPGAAAIAEYSKGGVLVSPVTGYTGGGAYGNNYYGTLNNLVFDSTGSNLWSSDGDFGDFYQVSAATGQLVYDFFPSGGQVTSVAAGATGNIYACPAGPSNIDVFNASSNGVLASYPSATGRGCGAEMQVDGLGHIWVLNGVLDEYSSTGTLLSPATGYTATSSDEAATFANASRFAFDASGNVWVMNINTGNDTTRPYNALVEIVGAAAPVATPASRALAEGKVAERP